MSSIEFVLRFAMITKMKPDPNVTSGEDLQPLISIMRGV